jgi:hypothetical protein
MDNQSECTTDELNNIAGGYPSLQHEDTHASSSISGSTGGPSTSGGGRSGWAAGGYPPGTIVINPWMQFPR